MYGNTGRRIGDEREFVDHGRLFIVLGEIATSLKRIRGHITQAVRPGRGPLNMNVVQRVNQVSAGQIVLTEPNKHLWQVSSREVCLR